MAAGGKRAALRSAPSPYSLPRAVMLASCQNRNRIIQSGLISISGSRLLVEGVTCAVARGSYYCTTMQFFTRRRTSGLAVLEHERSSLSPVSVTVANLSCCCHTLHCNNLHIHYRVQQFDSTGGTSVRKSLRVVHSSCERNALSITDDCHWYESLTLSVLQ